MKVKILILALSIVTLAGCGNDESPLGDTTGNSGPTALHVNGNVCMTSRANDTRWEANDRIGIYMLAGKTVEQNNRLYTTTDGSGKFTATEAEAIYLPTDGSRRNFVAYYPYTENLGDNGRTYTIDITDQSSQSAIDLLGSDNPETDKNTPSVRFHVLPQTGENRTEHNQRNRIRRLLGFGRSHRRIDRTTNLCDIRRHRW